jgi:tetratricopeptide (TPR) repeat protein
MCFLTSFAQIEKDIISKIKVALKKCAEDIPEPPVILKGAFTAGKITFQGVIYYHKPNNRMEFTMQNLTFISFSNDTLTWNYNPITDEHMVKPIETQEKEKNTAIANTYDFGAKDLLKYKSLNHQVKYLGKQQMDSLEVYILELTKTNKSKFKYYINSRTNLIYKIEGDEGYRYYSNYKGFGPYVYPAFVLQNFLGNELETKFDFISIDAFIADSLFNIPEKALNQKNKLTKKIEALVKQGDSLYLKNDYESAIQKYTDVIQLDKRNQFGYSARGLAKIYSHQYYEAIGDFNLALNINPNFAAAINNRGMAKFYLGDNDGAISDYTKALEIDSTLVNGYKNRGLSYLRLDQGADAEIDFSKAINLKPDDGDAYFKYGVAKAQLQQYDEALISYAKAIHLQYKTAELYNYRGISEYQLEKYDSASVSFNKALGMEPDNIQYLDNYANSLYKQDDFNNARKQFEQYLKVKSDNPDTYNMIGLCKYFDEDFKGAIKDFTKSIELNRKNATYFDNRAAAKEMLEDYVGAIDDYSESISIYPNDASVFYKRGLIKIRTSKKIEGCLDLSTANEMKYEPAKEAILKDCH